MHRAAEYSPATAAADTRGVPYDHPATITHHHLAVYIYTLLLLYIIRSVGSARRRWRGNKD